MCTTADTLLLNVNLHECYNVHSKFSRHEYFNVTLYYNMNVYIISNYPIKPIRMSIKIKRIQVTEYYPAYLKFKNRFILLKKKKLKMPH